MNPANQGPLSEYTKAECGRLAIPLDPRRRPQQLHLSDLINADRVIAVKATEHRPMMQAHFPAWVNRVEYWEVHDLDCAEPAETLNDLRRRVASLIAELA